jgi:hypothetical protein
MKRVVACVAVVVFVSAAAPFTSVVPQRLLRVSFPLLTGVRFIT